MNKFRQRDGDMFVAPPFDVEMKDVFLFLLRADNARLQAVCDNDLNIGPNRYQPLGNFVVLYGAMIANLSQNTTTLASEIGFWIPVMTMRGGAMRLLTYTRYVWLDSSTSTRVGRTLYGYPKQVADVRVPTPGSALWLEVIGEALVPLDTPGTYDTERTSILKVRPGSSQMWTRPPTHGLKRWLDLAGLVAELAKDLVALPGVGVEDLVQLLRGQRSVFLRQFPGVGPLDPPSYQALIEASIVPRPLTVSGARLAESGWEVIIPSYAQPSIARTLGLHGIASPDGKSFIASPIGVAWMEFAGTLEPGTEVWRAT